MIASRRLPNHFFSAAKEEKKLTCDENGVEDTIHVNVSGDGTWKKRGYSSLYGVSTLIGYYSGKVLDVFVKCSYCKGQVKQSGKNSFWKRQTYR